MEWLDTDLAVQNTPLVSSRFLFPEQEIDQRNLAAAETGTVY